jgi:hypothetical protein
MYVCVYVCMYVCMDVCMCVYVCMCVCMFMYVCMHICMYVYVRKYVFMYVHICVISPPTTFTFLTSVKTQLSLSYRKLSSQSTVLSVLPFSHLAFRKLSVSLPNSHFSDFTPNGFNVEISVFRRGVVEVFALLRCYAV